MKCTTTCAPTYRPDMLICNDGESSYLGDDVYNTTGTNQTSTRAACPNATIIYRVRLQNDGNLADSFTLTGTGGNGLWHVKYVDEAMGDVTADMVSAAGWTTPAMDAGAVRDVRVEATPLAGASGQSRDLWVKATSATDATKRDTVIATTRVVGLPTFRSAWLSAHDPSPSVDALYDFDGDGKISVADATTFVEMCLKAGQ